MNIHLLPSFHYDVVYLKSYREYLDISLQIINRALDILVADPDYKFTVEQTILVEEFWNRYPERRRLLKELATTGRLEFSPGMYVMPDMNMIDGESMFMQAMIGFEWLQRTLGITPRSCWIADCWGHHAQLPQILSQAGYHYYFFYRCMRREVNRNNFFWQGIDGTAIKTHWLATGYANLHFPDRAQAENLLELDIAGVSPEAVNKLVNTISEFGADNHILICNGGDFCPPQPSTPNVVRMLNDAKQTPPISFSTPSEYMNALDWSSMPTFSGEFNSLFQGSFTSNIRIKQRNHYLGQRLQSLEKLAAVTRRKFDFTPAWKLLLKQQFHDAICGTICDDALAEIYRDYDQLENILDAAAIALGDDTDAAVPTLFNPLSVTRSETVTLRDRRYRVNLPPLGFSPLPQPEPAPETIALPDHFANAFYHAEFDSQGYISKLKTVGGSELINHSAPCRFGHLVMQMDYGDLWMNFNAPINGGCPEAGYTGNTTDPLELPSVPLINNRSYTAGVNHVQASRTSRELIIRQEGDLNFWAIKVGFSTEITLSEDSPVIRYRTEIKPSGRHYRIRAAFPSNIADGRIIHEIPFGWQEREAGEHAAQGWLDYSSAGAGLSMFNRGIPANNVDQGCLLLTLFRSVAMEYKTASVASYNENIPHSFEYAIMPHDAPDFGAITTQSQSFTTPPLMHLAGGNAMPPEQYFCSSTGIHISALRVIGNDLFIRLYEATGAATATDLHLPAHIRAIAPADGLGNPTASFAPVNRQTALSFHPFEIKSFLLRFAPDAV